MLGEAARHVSIEFQQAHPEIDWRNSIGVRNIIAHPYKKVDHQILWHNSKGLAEKYDTKS